MNKLILTAEPSITQKEIDYVIDAIRNGHGEHWGDYIKRFEKAFAGYLGVKHALATSSCTGAMHLAWKALGIGRGDEVIIPDMSWIATASAICYTGAKPIFADVLYDSWCIDPDSILKHITKRTRAIMPVHLYGMPASMYEIAIIAEEYGLKVVEDAAPAVGAKYYGQKVGTLGDIGCFSFQGAKTLSTGEGGMLVTNNDELFDKVKHFAEHGRVEGGGFEIGNIGFKYKMSNLQAAMGLAQIERVEELIAKKIQIYNWYREQLGHIEGLSLNKQPSSMQRPTYWMTSIVLDHNFPVTRDVLRIKLFEKGIDARPFFPPMSSFRMFKNTKNIVAEYLGANGINLPSAHNRTHEEISYICDSIKEILGV